ncbi:MAG: acyl-CoA thioesterase [Eubacteriales bacterium]|nr:acyl-CoA thioesterase [Eubacteriales bacterium]
MQENVKETIQERRMKTVADSQVEQSYLLMPRHINGDGRLFGGRLLEWIDEVAGIVAKRHAESEVVTACLDNMVFKSGAYRNDTVVVRGHLTYVGKSSMEVRVDSYREALDGTRTVINRVHVVMVAVDENGKPRAVPGLIVEGESAQAEWEAAKKRVELRKIRHAEGF